MEYITTITRSRFTRYGKVSTFEKEINLNADKKRFWFGRLTDVRKKIPDLDSKKLGDMKLDNEAYDVIFLSNGFYRFNEIWKKRGIGYDNEKKQEIEHEDTKIDKDGNLYIKVKTTRNTHIKSGILYNMLKKVGRIETYEKKINLNSDKKRFWLSELKSLNDGTFCDSIAMPIDIVGKLVSKDEVAFYDDEKYDPESEL